MSIEVVEIKDNTPKNSVNFGLGVEMLMNEKKKDTPKKENTSSPTIELQELEKYLFKNLQNVNHVKVGNCKD